MTDRQDSKTAKNLASDSISLAWQTRPQRAKEITGIAILLIAVLSSLPVYAGEKGLPPLEGIWFTCEFATSQSPPDDRCAMFDDEGFSVEDGKITYLRNIASTETACRGHKEGQCFAANTHNITVSDRLIGAARIKGQQLLVSYMGCTQKFDLQTSPDYVSVIPTKDLSLIHI